MGSLRRPLCGYRSFFNGHRPHRRIGNRIPDRQATGDLPLDQGCMASGQELEVECEQFLGGLPKSYSRKAA